jgi:hypothetical protein
MTIKIGKANDNDYVIDDFYVSRYHARLVSDKDGLWVLEDLDSTNGTFVNGSQIKKTTVSVNDQIVLGGQYILDLNDVLRRNNDYSKEFLLLKDVYAGYMEKKLKIQSSNVFKTRIYQSLPFAAIGVMGLLFGFTGKGSLLLLSISLGIAVCAPVIGIYFGAKQSSKVPRLLHTLTNQFKIDYVCPKCRNFLGEIPWESLRNKRHCPMPNCKARWTNE